MAIDKADTGAVQVEATKTAPKKVTKKAGGAGGKKHTSQLQKVVNDAKVMYSDLDMSEGRKMRKRPASSAPAVAKKAKKTVTKKAPAAKKTAAKKGAKPAGDENKNE